MRYGATLGVYSLTGVSERKFVDSWLFGWFGLLLGEGGGVLMGDRHLDLN